MARRAELKVSLGVFLRGPLPSLPEGLKVVGVEELPHQEALRVVIEGDILADALQPPTLEWRITRTDKAVMVGPRYEMKSQLYLGDALLCECPTFWTNS